MSAQTASSRRLIGWGAVAYVAVLAVVAAVTLTTPSVGTQLSNARSAAAGAAELDAAIAHSDAYGQVVAGCMNDLGFTDVTWEGAALSYLVPPTSESGAFDLALNLCEDKNNYPDTPVPLSDAAYSVQYDRLLTTYDCLVENGYGPQPPVARETFIDSASEAWHPYDGLLGGDHGFMAACPVPRQ